MSVRSKHGNEPTLYFISFTCYNWLHLFSLTNSFDLVYKWFNYLQQSKIRTTAFVIMPNHVHVILFFPEENYDLNKIISNAKRFMAYEIVARLKQQCNQNILQELAVGISDAEKRKGQLHKVFENSFDAKPVYNRSFL